MAAARALVSVRKIADGGAEGKPVPLPAVLLAPIRPDIVRFVHTSMNKNSRQPYAVSEPAGHQHSAESWGTGRAVSRIPRVSGGGNSRSGQGAFGNMCRKGRMFGPTKIWRKWHKRINQKQKRYATASALAASALPALVMARGHRVDAVEELPLIADNSLENVTRTKQAVAALKALGAFADVAKARDSKKLRAGVGKQRNRRHVLRKGPLIVYNQDNGLVRAFRNLPGVELAQVERLNLLQLAPGGHLGRFVVWTRDAFVKLNEVWGSVRRESSQKKGWKIPRARVFNSDITRIINSDEVQSKVRPAKKTVKRAVQKKNPLVNLGARVKLNPYALALRRSELLAQERRAARKAGILADRRAGKLSDRSLAEAQGLAADKTHEAQQRINYLKIVRDDFDGAPAKLTIRSAKDNVKRGGAPPAAQIFAAAAEGKKREKVEDPSVQRGSSMNFAGAAESKLTHSHDRGGIEISIGCRKLVKMDWLSKSDPLVALFIANDAGEYEHYDQTEWKKNNHDPDFEKTIFVPSSLTGKKLRFNVYDVDDDSKVTGDDYMGSVDVIYSSIKEAANTGKPVTQVIKHPTDKLQDKKLTKSGASLLLSCKSVGTGFDLKKCLEYTKKHLAGLKRKDIPDVNGFVAELEKRFKHVDRDASGLVSVDELRQAVWEGEVDNKGKKMPAGKFPPALQDIVDEIFKGTGEKPEFTYWDFLNYTLRDSLAIDDLDVNAPANSPWAYV